MASMMRRSDSGPRPWSTPAAAFYDFDVARRLEVAHRSPVWAALRRVYRQTPREAWQPDSVNFWYEIVRRSLGLSPGVSQRSSEVAAVFEQYLYYVYLPLARKWLPGQATEAVKIWPDFETFNNFLATEEFLTLAGMSRETITAVMEPRNWLLAQTVTKLVKKKLSSCFPDKLWCYAAGVVLTHEFYPSRGNLICVGSGTKVIQDKAYLRPKNACRRGVFVLDSHAEIVARRLLLL
jgi:hypothetical protein